MGKSHPVWDPGSDLGPGATGLLTLQRLGLRVLGLCVLSPPQVEGKGQGLEPCPLSLAGPSPSLLVWLTLPWARLQWSEIPVFSLQ